MSSRYERRGARQPRVVRLAKVRPRAAPITPMSAAKVHVGAPCCTDADTIAHVPTADEDHQTVNHGADTDARPRIRLYLSLT